MNKLLTLCLFVITLGMNAHAQNAIILTSQEEAQIFLGFSDHKIRDVGILEMRNLEKMQALLIIKFLLEHKEHLTNFTGLSIHACRIDKNFMLQIEELRAWRVFDLEYSYLGLDSEMADLVPQFKYKDRISLHQIMTSKNNMEKLLKIATEFRSVFFNYSF